MSDIPKSLFKRPFLLLEVMIAFTLVLLCVVPLLRTHLMMLQQGRAFVKEMEVERLSQVIHGEVVTLLWENQIPWEMVVGNSNFPLREAASTPPLLAAAIKAKRLGFDLEIFFETIQLKEEEATSHGCAQVAVLQKYHGPKKVITHARELVIERKPMEVSP